MERSITLPSMTDTDNMIHITQRKLQQLIRQDTRRVRKPKERMIRKHSPQTHRARMQDRLMAQITQTPMPMHNIDLLADNNIPKHREKGKHRWEGGLPVDHVEGDMIHLQAVGEVAYSVAPAIGMCYDHYFVAAIDELAG